MVVNERLISRLYVWVCCSPCKRYLIRSDLGLAPSVDSIITVSCLLSLKSGRLSTVHERLVHITPRDVRAKCEKMIQEQGYMGRISLENISILQIFILRAFIFHHF